MYSDDRHHWATAAGIFAGVVFFGLYFSLMMVRGINDDNKVHARIHHSTTEVSIHFSGTPTYDANSKGWGLQGDWEVNGTKYNEFLTPVWYGSEPLRDFSETYLVDLKSGQPVTPNWGWPIHDQLLIGLSFLFAPLVGVGVYGLSRLIIYAVSDEQQRDKMNPANHRVLSASRYDY